MNSDQGSLRQKSAVGFVKFCWMKNCEHLIEVFPCQLHNKQHASAKTHTVLWQLTVCKIMNT